MGVRCTPRKKPCKSNTAPCLKPKVEIVVHTKNGKHKVIVGTEDYYDYVYQRMYEQEELDNKRAAKVLEQFAIRQESNG